eukprot:scaffold13016_cov154-Amphora_coffeaeformis.AAC.7
MNLVDLDMLLSEAVRNEDALVVQYLLRQGAHVPSDDDMLLPVAVQGGNVEKVKLLMEYCGSDFALKAKRLALQLAVFLDRPQIIEVLLEGGIDPEYVVSKTSKKTLLHECVLGNMSLESIQLLIQHGGNVNAQDEEGQTPLHSIAVKRGQHKKAQCLIEAGALPNTQCNSGKTPLHYACEEGLLETANALIGANPNVVDKSHHTPLHSAIESNSLAVVTWLIQEAGAKIHGYAEKPFFHSSSFDIEASCMMPSTLMKLGISPWETDPKGNTAMHYCCQRQCSDDESTDGVQGGECRYEFLDELVDHSPALLIAKNHLGATPLHSACTWSAELVGRLVRRHDADLSITDRFGRTPLVVAIMDGNAAVIQELLLLILQKRDHGLLLEQTNHDGWTALHWAALLRHSKAVELLIDAGAQVNVKNRFGRTPLSLVGFPLDSNQAFYSIDDSDVTRVINTKLPSNRRIMDTNDTQQDDAATVRHLLGQGANVTELDEYGNLPFFLAAATSRVSEIFNMMRAAASQGLMEMVASGGLGAQVREQKRTNCSSPASTIPP